MLPLVACRLLGVWLMLPRVACLLLGVCLMLPQVAYLLLPQVACPICSSHHCSGRQAHHLVCPFLIPCNSLCSILVSIICYQLPPRLQEQMHRCYLDCQIYLDRMQLHYLHPCQGLICHLCLQICLRSVHPCHLCLQSCLE